MKLVRSLSPIFGSIAVAGLLGGCGPSGPVAIPSSSTPIITEEVPHVEGVEPKPRKGAKEAPGPVQRP
jgi:hypothetical protein